MQANVKRTSGSKTATIVRNWHFVLSIILKVHDQKHERKTQGVMSGIVAAIWHLVLRSNLFYGNLYFHAIGPFSFWF